MLSQAIFVQVIPLSRRFSLTLHTWAYKKQLDLAMIPQIKQDQVPYKYKDHLKVLITAPLHPTTRSWEVSRNLVTIEKVIGKGAFGQVAKGTAINLRGRPGETTVAVKMLKGKTSSVFLLKLFNEFVYSFAIGEF